MSESSSASVSVMPQSSQAMPGHDLQGLARHLDNAMALCLKAVAPHTDEAESCEILETLETLLSTLGPSDITALMSEPDYRAIREQLLRIRAQTWFTRECELARRALGQDAASTLRSLFGEHIPREAYADELAVLQRLQPRRILILGSGACPMSAIVIQDAFPMSTVVGLDRSEEACRLSARLLAASGYGAVKIQHGEAQNPNGIGDFDCVVMALTVGANETEKRRIITELKTRANPNTMLAVRTAVGWGRVLYPSTGLAEIDNQAASQRAGSSQQLSVAIPVRMGELQI